MNETHESTVPTPQAVTAWKKKADKLVALEAELRAATDALAAKLAPIRQAHEPGIEKLKKQVAALAGEVEEFGQEHWESLFGDGSEVRTEVAIIIGKWNPAGVTLDEGFSEKEVVESLLADRTTKKFVAVKHSLDKAAIKKALQNAGEAIQQTLGLAGVALTQAFSVRVKPKEV